MYYGTPRRQSLSTPNVIEWESYLMASIGEMLRSAREAQGRSVADLASELCITQRYLTAIEADDVEVLPGLFFFQSFARQYAAILGLDQTQVRRALAAMEPPAELSASA